MSDKAKKKKAQSLIELLQGGFCFCGGLFLVFEGGDLSLLEGLSDANQ